MHIQNGNIHIVQVVIVYVTNKDLLSQQNLTGQMVECKWFSDDWLKMYICVIVYDDRSNSRIAFNPGLSSWQWRLKMMGLGYCRIIGEVLWHLVLGLCCCAWIWPLREGWWAKCGAPHLPSGGWTGESSAPAERERARERVIESERARERESERGI